VGLIKLPFRRSEGFIGPLTVEVMINNPYIKMELHCDRVVTVKEHARAASRKYENKNDAIRLLYRVAGNLCFTAFCASGNGRLPTFDGWNYSGHRGRQ
jgi:hypothetical protein